MLTKFFGLSLLASKKCGNPRNIVDILSFIELEGNSDENNILMKYFNFLGEISINSIEYVSLRSMNF